MQGFPEGWTRSCFPVAAEGVAAHKAPQLSDQHTSRKEVQLLLVFLNHVQKKETTGISCVEAMNHASMMRKGRANRRAKENQKSWSSSKILRQTSMSGAGKAVFSVSFGCLCPRDNVVSKILV